MRFDSRGFSLLEIMIYVALLGGLMLGAANLISTFRTATQQVEVIAEGIDDASILTDVLNSNLDSDRSSQVTMGYESGDNACLIIRNVVERNVWGCELDGGHIVVTNRDADGNTPTTVGDVTISFWFKDRGCDDQWGCMILAFGELSASNNVTENGRVLGLTVVHPPGNSSITLNEGEAQLSVKLLQKPGTANKAYYWDKLEHEIITSSTVGDWRHVTLVIHSDDSNNYTFAAANTAADGLQPKSIKLYIDGRLQNLSTTSSQSTSNILVDGVQQLMFYRNNATNVSSYNNHRGIIGPVQIWNKRLSDTEILSNFNNVFGFGDPDVSVSMRADEYEFNESIFGYDASVVNISTSLDAFCGTGSPDLRFCGVPFEADYDDYYVDTVTEWNIGRGFLFGKENRLIGGQLPAWQAQPSALFVNDAVGAQCFPPPPPGGSGPTDPRVLEGSETSGTNNDLTDYGWRRITDYKFRPGSTDAGNEFFSANPGGNVALRVAAVSDQNGDAGISNVTNLNLGRRIQNDNFCQIAPDTLEFTLPTVDSCSLNVAQVVIGKNFDAAKDQLYMRQNTPYRQDWTNFSSNPDACPEIADGVLEGALDEVALINSMSGSENVAVCRKGDPASDGIYYHVYGYKDLPLLTSNSFAIYDTQSGALKIESRSASDITVDNPLQADVWESIFKLVRYRIRDGVATDAEYDRFRNIAFSLGDKLAMYPPDDPDTPHYYEFVASTDIEWDDSRTDANSSTHCGLNGYMASITSQEEQDFLFARFTKPTGGVAAGWLGGTDEGTEGIWEWIDGPEHGQRFTAEYDTGNHSADALRRRLRHVRKGSTELCGGSANYGTTTNLGRFATSYDPYPESTGGHPCAALPGPDCGSANLWMYQNWAAYRDSGNCRTTTTSTSTNPIFAEPNEAGPEDYLQLTGHTAGMGIWNDLPNGGGSDINSKYYIWGYYREFGGCADGSCSSQTGMDEAVDLSINVDDFDLYTYRQLCQRPPATP